MAAVERLYTGKSKYIRHHKNMTLNKIVHEAVKANKIYAFCAAFKRIIIILRSWVTLYIVCQVAGLVFDCCNHFRSLKLQTIVQKWKCGFMVSACFFDFVVENFLVGRSFRKKNNLNH